MLRDRHGSRAAAGAVCGYLLGGSGVGVSTRFPTVSIWDFEIGVWVALVSWWDMVVFKLDGIDTISPRNLSWSIGGKAGTTLPLLFGEGRGLSGSHNM